MILNLLLKVNTMGYYYGRFWKVCLCPVSSNMRNMNFVCSFTVLGLSNVLNFHTVLKITSPTE